MKLVLLPATLGGRLIAAFTTITLVTSAVLSLVEYRRGRTQLLREAAVALNERAATVAERLDHEIAERARSIATWTGLEVAQDLAVDDVDKRLTSTLERLARTLGPGDRVYAVAAGPTGHVVASSDRSAIGTPVTEVPGLRAALDAAPTHPGPTLLRDGERARLAFAAPVTGAGARVIGQLILISEWHALARAIAPAGGDERVEVRGPDGMPLGREPVEQADGDYVHGQARSAAIPWFPYVAIVGRPRDAVVAPVREAQRATVLLAIIVVAFTVPVVALLVRSTTRPLRQLTVSAMAVADTERPSLSIPASERAPEEVRVLSHALEGMVTRLEQSRREVAAQESLAAIGTMAAALAHEIRTPLGVVRGSVGLLTRGATPERQNELAAMVSAEIGRLERLVNDLLIFARPRPPAVEDVELSAFTKRVAATLHDLAQRCRVEIQLRGEPATALADPDQLTQVVLNLLENAIQASAPGSTVTIATKRAGAHAELAVIDHGRGIPPEMLGQVWTPFVSTRRTGTGLGLAIVKRIIDEHRGKVSIESAPGEGTTVTVTLPGWSTAG
jgi:two-component system, NtrC family, sensor histidine kinase HydH